MNKKLVRNILLALILSIIVVSVIVLSFGALASRFDGSVLAGLILSPEFWLIAGPSYVLVGMLFLLVPLSKRTDY